MSLLRLDQILQKLYPKLSRTKAQTLIAKGKVLTKNKNKEWKPLCKPGQKFSEEELTLENIKILEEQELAYVSRAALKLEAALTKFSLPLEGKICLDVGLSTGGFSELMINKGAEKVMGVDVGKSQLHPSLKGNERLVAIDGINARHPLPLEELETFFPTKPYLFDFISIDVSFISLKLIIPNLVNYLKPEGCLVALVKPQFELSRGALNKKGVVRNEQLVEEALQKNIGVFQESGLSVIGHCPSPIEGENGNKEILLVARLSSAHP